MYPHIQYASNHAAAYPTPACEPHQCLGSVSLSSTSARAKAAAAKQLQQMFPRPTRR